MRVPLFPFLSGEAYASTLSIWSRNSDNAWSTYTQISRLASQACLAFFISDFFPNCLASLYSVESSCSLFSCGRRIFACSVWLSSLSIVFPFPFVAVWLCLENSTIFRFFQVFLPFFVFGVSRVFSPCFGLSPCLPCRGRSYLFIWLAWQIVSGWLSRCVADRARVCRFGVSRISRGSPSSACRCCRCCRSVCVWPCIGGGCSHPVAVCVFRRFELSRFRAVCIGGRLSAFRTNVSNKCSTAFLGQSVRISNRILEIFNRIRNFFNRILTEY